MHTRCQHTDRSNMHAVAPHTPHAPPLHSDPPHPPPPTPPHPFPGLCYCFENMIAVTDGVGRGEGSGWAEWQGSSIVRDQCESVSIAIETGATLGRHAFISATGSPLAIRGQINPPSTLHAHPRLDARRRGWGGAGGGWLQVDYVGTRVLAHTHSCTHAHTQEVCLPAMLPCRCPLLI